MISASGAASAAPLPDGAFVRALGTQFTVDGRPFVFVGANLAVVQGERERARYRDTLRALAEDGLTVGRVWAVGEGPADASEWYRRDHLFRAGPEGFVEESYVQLDRVLAAAREEGIRLIVTLGNHWSDYGGVPMYLRWAGKDPEVDREAFYSDEKTRAFYRAHVDKLLHRTNTITGVRYIDDPAIFAWELLNESVVVTPAGAAARRAWIVEMAGYIKARDPNHLVAPGIMGYSTRAERAEWIRVHQLAQVDYCDSHLYPQAPEPPGGVRSWRRLAELVDDRAQLARFVIKKPLVIGEFGFHTADARGRPARTWLRRPRAAWFERFVAHVLRDGGAGALAWIYQPWLGKARDFGIYVDEPATGAAPDTRDVRRALALLARRISVSPPNIDNPRLGAAVGDALLYDPQVHLYGAPAPHARWQRHGEEHVLAIAPARFAEAHFDNAGRWDKGALEHVYGAGAGRFVYRFTAPDGAAARALRISARLSSEWPGGAGVAVPGSAVSGSEVPGSVVIVRIDGVRVARRAVAGDDGAGRREEFVVDDPALLSRLAAPGEHRLTFEVAEGEGGNGLCIYGRATGRGTPPKGGVGPIRIRWRSGDSAGAALPRAVRPTSGSGAHEGR